MTAKTDMRLYDTFGSFIYIPYVATRTCIVATYGTYIKDLFILKDLFHYLLYLFHFLLQASKETAAHFSPETQLIWGFYCPFMFNIFKFLKKVSFLECIYEVLCFPFICKILHDILRMN